MQWEPGRWEWRRGFFCWNWGKWEEVGKADLGLIPECWVEPAYQRDNSMNKSLAVCKQLFLGIRIIFCDCLQKNLRDSPPGVWTTWHYTFNTLQGFLERFIHCGGFWNCKLRESIIHCILNLPDYKIIHFPLLFLVSAVINILKNTVKEIVS